MDISLKPEDQKFVETQVAAGRYADAGEVVHEALELLQRRLQASGRGNTPGGHIERLWLLRRRIEESGIPLLDDDEVRAEIRKRKGTRG